MAEMVKTLIEQNKAMIEMINWSTELKKTQSDEILNSRSFQFG